MNSIEKILDELGPSISSHIVAKLVDSYKISPNAARKRLSRAQSPIERSSHRLFPKNEDFYFLQSQYKTEWYWKNLLRDLRNKNTVYACALDGISARGGIVKTDEFAVISGAPIALKKQISLNRVKSNLIKIEAITEENKGRLGRCFIINPRIASAQIDIAYIKAVNKVEYFILEELREWLRKNNLGSYNKIAIRGDDKPLKAGQFKFDLTGPSYFRPLRESEKAHGFVVADVFANGPLEPNQIKYFVRKIEMYEKTANSGKLYPILLADRFQPEAFNEARSAGVMVTTLEIFFGKKVAQAIINLIEMLASVISDSSVDESKLDKLLSSIPGIEGRVGNMRGILFELISAYIAKRKYGGQINIGISHIHRKKNNKTDLDVVCVGDGDAVNIIECKGKGPDGEVSLKEVESWLKRIQIMRDYIDSRPDLYNKKITYEMWTTGKFHSDALRKLETERKNRTKQRIAWKNGSEILAIAITYNLHPIVEALNEHYLKHPYNRLL